MSGPGFPSFPCFYRSHVYFLSNAQNRQTFMQDPMTFLKQETPKPVVPLKISIIGPPKSGKSTCKCYVKRFLNNLLEIAEKQYL